MAKSLTLTQKDIEAAVVRLLGRKRVRSVQSEIKLNDDGAAIARVTIVYAAQDGLTVDEMGQVLDAVWPGDGSDSAPVPVIDFQEDTDVDPVAAE